MNKEFTNLGKYNVDFGYYKYLMKYANKNGISLTYPISNNKTELNKYDGENLIFDWLKLINRYSLLNYNLQSIPQ